MPLIPTYDPKSFASVDLRKYHIRDIKDVIKFHEFVQSRMEECTYVLKKFNTQMVTFKAISNQLRKKQEIQQQSYGAAPRTTVTQETAPEIQKVDRSVEKQHEELLEDIRQAQAEDNLADAIKDSESDDPIEAILGKYKLVYGKKGPMYYREGEDGKVKLTKQADIPEDIKQQLLHAVGKD